MPSDPIDRADGELGGELDRDGLRLFEHEATAGVALTAALLAAIIWATAAPHSYESFVSHPISIWSIPHAVVSDVESLVTNLFMVIFFAAIGLEIGRERAEGSLADRRTATLPVVAALGGMLMAALVYLAATAAFGSSGTMKGWGIPMATDVAFTLGTLSLLGSRIPVELRIFLLTLAVADDVGSVVVLAFVGHQPSVSGPWILAGSLLGLVAIAACIAAARRRDAPWGIYVLLLMALWWCLAHLGVEATLAGVVVGVAVPAGHTTPRLPGLTLETAMVPMSNYVVLPLFALVAGGVDLSLAPWKHGSSVLVGIVAARTIGKVVGIVGAVALTISIAGGRLPRGVSWRQMIGAALLCGIGFTVPLLFAQRAFGSAPALLAETKVALLIASVIGGVSGYAMLRSGSTKPASKR